MSTVYGFKYRKHTQSHTHPMKQGSCVLHHTRTFPRTPSSQCSLIPNHIFSCCNRNDLTCIFATRTNTQASGKNNPKKKKIQIQHLLLPPLLTITAKSNNSCQDSLHIREITLIFFPFVNMPQLRSLIKVQSIIRYFLQVIYFLINPFCIYLGIIQINHFMFF